MSASPACSAGYAAADWRSLAAHRFDSHREEPEPGAWAEALAHLDGCPACRLAALAADPTLVFRRLRSAAPIASESEEVAAVQQAVAALRSAARVGSAHAGSRRVLGLGPLSAWPRWAAAAVLAVAALAAGSAGPARPAPATAPFATALAAPPPAPAFAVVPAGMRTVAGAALRPAQMPLRAAQMPLRAAQMPMLEELDRPDARVYQIDGGNLSVVMIVDEGLDV